MSSHNGGPLAQDVARLRDSRVLLVERLERVLAALALTLDAEDAAAERLARTEEAGVPRIAGGSGPDRCRLAQRYRDVIHALETINDDFLVVLGRGGTV